MFVTSTLTAENMVVHYIDVVYTETSGFNIHGSDYTLGIPVVATRDTLTLSGVGISGTSWASFYGDLQTKRDLYVSGTAYIANAFFTNLTAISLSASNASIYNASIYNLSGVNNYFTHENVINSNITNLTAISLSAYDINVCELIAGNILVNGGVSAQDVNIIGSLYVSGDLSFDNSTIVTAVTSTGMWFTLSVNGSALAIPLYQY